MSYPVFICDDDITQVEFIKETVIAASYIVADDKINFSIKTASSYTEATNILQEMNLDGGIYFLDIELGNNNENTQGFDLAELIKQKDERSQIIFVTSHRDLSIISFERRLGPLDYIVKSTDSDKFKQRVVESLGLAIKQIDEFNLIKKATFSYKIGRHIFNMNIDDVIFLKTTEIAHHLHLVKTTGEGNLIGNINEYERNNPLLLRVSQSCLANPKNISSVDLNHRVLKFINGDTELFSRSLVPTMKDLMQQYNLQTEQLLQLEKKYQI